MFIVPGSADPEFQKIFAPAFLPVDSSSPSVDIVNLNLAKLTAGGSASWRYRGGLTTPATTCNAVRGADPLDTKVFPEIVRWYVLQDLVHLPIEDMQKYHALFEEGDSRAAAKLAITDACRGSVANAV